MTAQFFSLGWKKFFRSAYWKKSILANIFMGLLALYFIGCFLIIGIAVYPGLSKAYPDSNPFVLVNEYILFFLMGDLVIRYFMQKIPVMDVKPLLLLNIKKPRIVRYILNKSIFSFFNVLPLFFWTTTIYNYQHQPTSSGIIIDHVSDYIELTSCPSVLLACNSCRFPSMIIAEYNTKPMRQTTGRDFWKWQDWRIQQTIISLKVPLSINSKQQQRHMYKAYKMWDDV